MSSNILFKNQKLKKQNSLLIIESDKGEQRLRNNFTDEEEIGNNVPLNSKGLVRSQTGSKKRRFRLSRKSSSKKHGKYIF